MSWSWGENCFFDTIQQNEGGGDLILHCIYFVFCSYLFSMKFNNTLIIIFYNSIVWGGAFEFCISHLKIIRRCQPLELQNF